MPHQDAGKPKARQLCLHELCYVGFLSIYSGPVLSWVTKGGLNFVHLSYTVPKLFSWHTMVSNYKIKIRVNEIFQYIMLYTYFMKYILRDCYFTQIFNNIPFEESHR